MTSKRAPRTRSEPAAHGSQRIDQWLWFARIAKTRTMATRAVESGKVRVNRTRISKASRSVQPGDVITLTLHGQVRVLKITGIGERRGPAAEAQLLYEDKSPPPVKQPSRVLLPAPPAQREKGSGRPTKKDRRRMIAWLKDKDASED